MFCRDSLKKNKKTIGRQKKRNVYIFLLINLLSFPKLSTKMKTKKKKCQIVQINSFRATKLVLGLTRAVELVLNEGTSALKPSRPSSLFSPQVRRNQLHVPGVYPLLWVSHLPFAEDVHSEAARLSLTYDETPPNKVSLMLTLVRAVPKGEALSFWFSSEVASELGMPFLTFSHVKG